MAATGRHVELDSSTATAANTAAATVALALAAPAVPGAGAVAATAGAVWLPAASIAADMERESAGVIAGLASHGIRVAHTHEDAVTAAVGTDEENSRALTVVPEVAP